MENVEETGYFKGRGSQSNPNNKFHRHQFSTENIEGLDEPFLENSSTEFIKESSKKVISVSNSPDLHFEYSINPYQGCEHGCIYCYARNTHEYWGYSAGLDFERKIIVKKNAPALFRKFLMNPKWQCVPISLSGNTDCYQPAEKKFRITRQLLEICLEFNQPVGMITKNAGILRDKDLLVKLAEKDLVCILVSVTSLDEELRRKMEPRTTTARQRLRVISELSAAGVRMGVMTGPMIPGLNEQEMPKILKAAHEAGAVFSAYPLIRLNGSIKLIFHDWLYKNFPDRADKVWHLVESCHAGQVNDSEYGRRMRGAGSMADLINHQFKLYTKRYQLRDSFTLNTSSFMRPGQQGSLF